MTFEFDLERLKAAREEQDFASLEKLMSDLEQKWGKEKLAQFLDFRAAKEEQLTDEEAWKLHDSFGKLPK